MGLGILKRALPDIPDYQILKRLDEGGMSTVYKGRHRPTGRTVAIKVLKERKGNDVERLARFEQEFQGARRLLHPNMVQVLDFHRDAAGTYLIMEFVEGPDLYNRVCQGGRLAEEEALRVATQVGQALHYAHGHKIIHRDVKPQNILLTANGVAKLTDFGLMKDVDRNLCLTDPLSVLGTPHFMAPEQCEDARRVDARSDIYSLAATLYCALTGHLPFEGGSALQVLARQARNDLVPPRRWVPGLSEHVERAVVRAMHPNPDRRPATVLDFVEGLRPRRQPNIPAEVPLAGDDDNRRSGPRYHCTLATVCAIQDSLHDEADSVEQWPATVQDIAPGGVCLFLGRRFEPGTVLTVMLRQGDAMPPATHEARVVRVHERGAGLWQVGCRFVPRPLTEEELRALTGARRRDGSVAAGAANGC
jgi:serine/threonine protein kinase